MPKTVNKEKEVESLTQIIEDLYVNWRIKTLDNYIGKHEKKILGIINNKDRKVTKERMAFYKEQGWI